LGVSKALLVSGKGSVPPTNGSFDYSSLRLFFITKTICLVAGRNKCSVFDEKAQVYIAKKVCVNVHLIRGLTFIDIAW
jgi:hypothetical protein